MSPGRGQYENPNKIGLAAPKKARIKTLFARTYLLGGFQGTCIVRYFPKGQHPTIGESDATWVSSPYLPYPFVNLIMNGEYIQKYIPIYFEGKGDRQKIRI